MIELAGVDELMRGTHDEIELVVTPTLPFETTGIEVIARGVDGWKHSGQLANHVVHLERTRLVIGRALLQPEAHRFPIPLALPSTLAPSHALHPASSSLEVLVRVGVPRFWRIDLRRRFSLSVREPPPGTLDRTSIAARGDGREHLAIALAARQLVAGEMLVGTCVAFAVDDSRPREITLALVPRLRLFGSHREEQVEGTPRELVIPLPAGAAGRGLRFSFPVPRSLTPSFRAETHALSWTFVARLESRRDVISVEVPVTIVDRLAASRVEPLREPPVIAGASIGPYR